MTLENRIAEQVLNIKKLISEIESHSDDSDYFYKLSQKAEWLARDIDRVHSGYYVAFVDCGSEDDFDRIYYPLGLMTAERAREILNKELDSEDCCNECGIKEVSEEEIEKYYEIRKLQELYDRLVSTKYELKNILPNTFMDDLKIKIDQLRRDIGFRFRWEIVGCRYI